jgi:hypothetical protein
MMHNNYEIVRVEDDRIFIVPYPIDDIENFLWEKDCFEDYFGNNGYSETDRVRFPKLETVMDQLKKNLGVDLTEMTRLSFGFSYNQKNYFLNGSEENHKGYKKVIFGFKDGDTLIWKEVVILGHLRNRHPRISGGGGLMKNQTCYDHYLIEYNEHTPKEEEINGVANSWLFLKTGGLS